MTLTPDPEPAATQPAAGRALPAGERLRDYEIKGLVGKGACSIVYLAWDHSLQRKVAVKEYMPASMTARAGSRAIVVEPEHLLDAFEAGLKSFVDEARLLARFDHPSLVKVYRFWEDNGTAYMVMPFYEGPTLRAALAEIDHVPSERELRAWLKPILNAVAVLHEGRTWHQNIGPDDIVLAPAGPVLLGFGAAARTIEALRQAPAAALKTGFAAIEQYESGAGTRRGPWTDLYALAAVVYSAITGAEPAPAPERVGHDPVRPLVQLAAGLYSAGFLAAIDAALAVQPDDRPRDHRQFRALMGDIDAPGAAVSLAPRRDLMQEPFLRDVPSYREITVPDRPLLVPAGPAPSAPAPLPAETKAPAALAAARVDRAAPQKMQRELPSWMPSSGTRSLGKRALYSVVAATFALAGLVALALQFHLRPAVRPRALAASASSPAAPRPAVPASSAAIVLSAAPAAASAETALEPPAAAASSSVLPRVAATPLERQARCIDLLQRASLERIGAAETEFFKSECK